MTSSALNGYVLTASLTLIAISTMGASIHVRFWSGSDPAVMKSVSAIQESRRPRRASRPGIHHVFCSSRRVHTRTHAKATADKENDDGQQDHNDHDNPEHLHPVRGAAAGLRVSHLFLLSHARS